MKPCTCYACTVTACTCCGLGMSPKYHDYDCRQVNAHDELRGREHNGRWDWYVRDKQAQRETLERGAEMRGAEMRWSE